MKKNASNKDRRTKRTRAVPKAVKWLAAIGGVGLVLFGITQMSSVAYTDADIRVVDFSFLSSSEKRTALEAANRARCVCGCGMTVAQCVATDSTCPIREQNIEKIKTMVREADNP